MTSDLSAVSVNTSVVDDFVPAFISLLDNYESATGVPEVVTPEEEAENHRFLDIMVQTSSMKVPQQSLDSFASVLSTEANQ